MSTRPADRPKDCSRPTRTVRAEESDSDQFRHPTARVPQPHRLGTHSSQHARNPLDYSQSRSDTAASSEQNAARSGGIRRTASPGDFAMTQHCLFRTQADRGQARRFIRPLALDCIQFVTHSASLLPCLMDSAASATALGCRSIIENGKQLGTCGPVLHVDLLVLNSSSRLHHLLVLASSCAKLTFPMFRNFHSNRCRPQMRHVT